MYERQWEENLYINIQQIKTYNMDSICISFIQTYEPPMLVEENLDQNAAKKQ